jgi:tetratricopeptide (TPR) repeat protein
MAPSQLQALAQAVANDVDVDWAAAEASSDPDERDAVRQLRIVASIGLTARRLIPTWGPFELRNQIGQGTFGAVYRAWDPKVDREVALKLLNERAGPAPDGGAVHEARLLATAEHPNIVPVYGADVHDGRVGIWMKFIHGRTLKDTLIEQGPFGAEEAARIGRDLCEALAVVHGRGLVHRDVKAQNVMREVGGRIVLMDFGAGQSLSSATGGALKGSPAYVAPEVVAGEPATPRSDIYSLAVLLFHLTTGEFPLTAASWDELRERHARRERRWLKDVRPDLPTWFVSAIDRALDPDPAKRPATAGEFLHLLEPASRASARRPIGGRTFVLAAGMAVLVAGTGAWLWTQRPAAAPVHAGASSIAVMSFENQTGVAGLDFLSSGLPRRVGASLSSLSGLRVVVPARTIKAGGVDTRGQMNVDSILDCRMVGDARRIRLRCQLQDSRSKQMVQADTAEHNVDDIVALESELARRVAFALKGPLSREEQRRLASGAINSDALALYLRGRHEWSFRTEDSLNRSIKYYEEALRSAPAFAPAYSGLADAYTLLGAYGFLSRSRANALALDAAERAVAGDPTLAESHFSMGYARKNRFDWADAEASFRRGLEINPDSSTGHHWFSIYLSQMGRFPEAIAEARLAISLDSSSLAARTNFASLLTMARRYRDSITEWESCITLGSHHVNTYRAMSKAYLYLGNHQRALELADAARKRASSGAADEELKADLGYVFAAAGRRDEAIELANELVLRYRSAGEGIAGNIAAIYTGLGDYGEAFAWLAVALRDQDPELGYLLVDPKWDPLRSDARFRQMLVDMHFPIP